MNKDIKLKPIITNDGEFDFKDNLITNFPLEYEFYEAPYSWGEIVTILRDEEADESLENRCTIIRNTTRSQQDGFCIGDVPHIVEVLQTCANMATIFPLFNDAIFEIIHTCRLPLLLTSRLDIVTFTPSASDLFEYLGCFMQSREFSMRYVLCKSIKEFYLSENYNGDPHQICSGELVQTTPAMNKEIIEDTNLPFIFANHFATFPSESTEFKVILLTLLNYISCTEHICEKILQCDSLIPALCASFEAFISSPSLLARELVKMSINLFINIVNLCQQDLYCDQLNVECINQLRLICVHFVLQSLSPRDKNIRNDVIMLIGMLASSLCDLSVFNSKIVRTICLFATFQEVKSHHVLVSRLKLCRLDPQDAVFKILLIHATIFLSGVKGAFKLYQECHLMKALLFYIDGHACAGAVSNVGEDGNIVEPSVEVLQAPVTNVKEEDDDDDECDNDDDDECDNDDDDFLPITNLHQTESESKTASLYSFWNSDQFAQIQMVALKAISRLGPHLLCDVIPLCVAHKLLKFISVASSPLRTEELRSTQRLLINNTLSFCHTRRLLRLSCAALLNLLGGRNFCVVQPCVSNHVFILLLDILDQCMLCSDWLNEDIKMDQEMVETLNDVIQCITTLCQCCSDYKSLIGRKGVVLGIKLLNADFKLLNFCHYHFPLLVSNVHLVRTCIYGHAFLEKTFIQCGGINALLNMLKDVPQSLQRQVLGLLADFLNNSKEADVIIRCFLTWRGEGFEDEEEEEEEDPYFDNVVGEDGDQVYKNKKVSVYRLLSGLWRREERRMGVLRDKDGLILDNKIALKGCAKEECPTNMDDTLPSLKDVRFDFRGRICAIFHKIGFPGNMKVSYRDSQTLVIIEHFLDLKSCEVWKDLLEESHHAAATAEEREALDNICRTIDLKLQVVSDKQNQLREERECAQLQEEKLFYEKFKSVPKTEKC